MVDLFVMNKRKHSVALFCDRVLFKKKEHTLDIFFANNEHLKTVLLYKIPSNTVY